MLAADGADGDGVRAAHDRLAAEGAVVETLAAHGGTLPDGDGEPLTVDRPLPTTASVLYDAVVVPDGTDALASDPDAVRFVTEALRHGKPMAVLGSGAALLRAAGAAAPERLAGVAVHGAGEPAGESFWADFTRLVEQHRFPQR